MKWFRTANLVCLAVYWLAMFTGTHLPAEALEGIPASDKTLHLLGYAGLAVLLTLAALPGVRPRPKLLAAVLLVLVTYAAFDEWSQRFVRGRASELGDWYADVAGSLLGMVIAILASAAAGVRDTQS